MARAAVALVLGIGLLAAAGSSSEGVHWTYSGERGPDHWAELSPDFKACGIGRHQSPIDIVDPVAAELGPIRLEYLGQTSTVTNNGHTLQVAVPPGSALVAEGQRFELLQFHLHSPSEHHIDGEAFPLELHLVHQNAAGDLAVVGILFREGPANEPVNAIVDAAPEKPGEQFPMLMDLGKIDFSPDRLAYFRYSGSLTTPPCSEGVRWFVLQEPRTVSPEQVERFVELIGEDARGPQPLNARKVLR